MKAAGAIGLGALVPMTAAAASSTTVLKSARLFDGFVFHEPGVLVVRGDRIVSMNAGDAGSDATVVDLGAHTLMPGLIDCHTHITGWLVASTQLVRPGDKFTADSIPLASVETLRNAQTLLRNGFTTIRDLGAEVGLDLGIRDSINRGLVVGPRVLACGTPLSIIGGHGDLFDDVPAYIQPNEEAIAPDGDYGISYGPYGFRERVREHMKAGVDVIKIMATGGVVSVRDAVSVPELNLDEIQAIVDEAAKFGFRVAAHCHGDRGSQVAARGGVHSIEHGTGASQETFEIMRQHGTYLVPTLWALDSIVQPGNPDHLVPLEIEKAKQILSLRDPGFRRALEVGVKIAYGSDAGVFPHEQSNRDFALMVKHGMQPLDVLKSATSSAADLLGVNDRGRLAPGMLADVVAVAGDPRSHIEAMLSPSFIMLGGKRIDATRLLV